MTDPILRAPQTWEYRTEFVKTGLLLDIGKKSIWDVTLKKAGEEGWELVQMMVVEGKKTRDGYHFVFKRPGAAL